MDISTDKITEQVACEVASQTDDAKKRIVQLEKRFQEAAKFLDEATASISESWIKWLKESKQYLDEARLWRMSVERETQQGIATCKDMLEFLGSNDTKARLATLKELVEVSERLKALKDSGFLDSIVDTLIKIKP